MCDPNRRAIVTIPHEYLREFVRNGVVLPDGYVALDMREDFIRRSWRILVTGPDCPEVPPGAEPPMLDLIVADGELLVRRWKHLEDAIRQAVTDASA